MDRLRALRELAACLRGELPPEPTWTPILELANQGLVTPELAAALQPVAGQVPPDVWAFLGEVRRRNQTRNQRLAAQLRDAVAALNGAGIAPVLLKGGALMAASPPGADFDRMLSDLDILVSPAEIEGALRALTDAGFTLASRQHGQAVHAAAELSRPQDVGYLDLHQRAPGPPGLADTAELSARRQPLRIDGGAVWAPDPASQILLTVLHDQFHDGDYWRGGFDLRHLLDLTRLRPALSPGDWAWLRRACATGLVRGALDAQLLAAERLLGPAGGGAGAGLHARLTVWRWRLQFAHPAGRLALAVLTAVLEGPRLLAHRAANRQGRRRVLGPGAPEPFVPGARLGRLGKIMVVGSGKI